MDKGQIEKLLDNSWQARGQGHYDIAKDLVQQAQALCEDSDYLSLGRIYHIFMQFESDHDNLPDAISLSRQSIAYYNQSKDRNKIAHSVRHLADLLFRKEEFAEAKLNYGNSITIYRELNASKGDLANALRGYAILLEKLREEEEAIRVWQEVRELYDSINLKGGVEEANTRLNSLNS